MKKKWTPAQKARTAKTVIILASIAYIWTGFRLLQAMIRFITSPDTSLNPFAKGVVNISVDAWIQALLLLGYILGSVAVIIGTLLSKRWAYITNFIISILYAILRSFLLLFMPFAIIFGGQSITIIIPEVIVIALACASIVSAIHLFKTNQ